MRKDNKKGITLIALVITIIVLLVLAGISLSLALGDNGVLNKAQNAKEDTKIAEEKELLGMSAYKAKFESKEKSIDSVILQNHLDLDIGNNKTLVYDDCSKVVVKFMDNDINRYYEIDDEGNISFIGYDEDVVNTFENIKIGKNIFKSENINRNTYINTNNGELISYEGWDSSDWIDCRNYNKIIIVSDSNAFLSTYNALYDTEKNFVKSISINKRMIHNDKIGDITASISILDKR